MGGEEDDLLQLLDGQDGGGLGADVLCEAEGVSASSGRIWPTFVNTSFPSTGFAVTPPPSCHVNNLLTRRPEMAWSSQRQPTRISVQTAAGWARMHCARREECRLEHRLPLRHLRRRSYSVLLCRRLVRWEAGDDVVLAETADEDLDPDGGGLGADALREEGGVLAAARALDATSTMVYHLYRSYLGEDFNGSSWERRRWHHRLLSVGIGGDGVAV